MSWTHNIEYQVCLFFNISSPITLKLLFYFIKESIFLLNKTITPVPVHYTRDNHRRNKMPYHTGTFFLSVNVSDFISTVSWDWFKKRKKKPNLVIFDYACFWMCILKLTMYQTWNSISCFSAIFIKESTHPNVIPLQCFKLAGYNFLVKAL